MRVHNWKQRLVNDASLHIPDRQSPEMTQESYEVIDRKSFLPDPPFKRGIYGTLAVAAAFLCVCGVGMGLLYTLPSEGKTVSEEGTPTTVTESSLSQIITSADESQTTKYPPTQSVTIAESTVQPSAVQPTISQPVTAPSVIEPVEKREVGNMFQNQMVAEFQGWLYYVARCDTGSYLYKMRRDGSEKQIVSENTVSSVTTYNEDLFYSSREAFVRLSSDGNETVYSISGDKHIVAEDWVYYIEYRDGSEMLCRTHLETKEKQEIYSFNTVYTEASFSERIASMCVVDEMVYYYSYGGMINRIDANKRTLVSLATASGKTIGSWAPNIYSDGEWLYYPDYFDPELGNQVGYRKIRLDGTQREMLASTWVQDTPWCLDDQWLYFADSQKHTLNKLRKDDADGRFQEICSIPEHPQSLTVLGDWAYLTYDKMSSAPNKKRTFSLIRVSIDGTEKEEIYTYVLS